jgi:hypothetical protein
MGLGIASNNEAKALSAYKGLQILKEHGAKKAVVVKGSSIIIRLLQYQVPSQNPCLSKFIHHIKSKAKDFKEVEFFPVLHSFNNEANKGVGMNKGLMKVKGEHHSSLPYHDNFMHLNIAMRTKYTCLVTQGCWYRVLWTINPLLSQFLPLLKHRHINNRMA